MWSNLWVFSQRFRTQSLERPSSAYCLALYVSTYPTSYPCTRNRLHHRYRRHYHVSSCLLTGTFSVVLRFARVLIVSTNIMEKIIIIIIIIIIILSNGNYFFYTHVSRRSVAPGWPSFRNHWKIKIKIV